MIQVYPPLPVKTLSHTGSLVEISATSLIVDWNLADVAAQTPKNTGTLTVALDEQRTISIDVQPIATPKPNKLGAMQYHVTAQSTPALIDLLHILRKSQHISLCAHLDVEHSQKNHGFAEIVLPILSLPEKSFNEIATDRKFLNRKFSMPLLITGMTGGVAQATMINERLARAASYFNIPMGVGSQRIALENPAHAEIFNVKKNFPKLFLIGNIGIGQLFQRDYFEQCQRAVDMIDADALAIHVNVLQELIQVEGDRNFKGLIEKIIDIHNRLDVPVIVKEVGAGLDAHTIKTLCAAGIEAFDVGGAGGTSWAHIEGLRSSDPWTKRRGEIFRDWGISTAQATVAARKAAPTAEIIATGGIRDGLTALKAIHLGANMVGVGLPLMRAAIENEEAPLALLESIQTELKIALMCSGLSISL